MKRYAAAAAARKRKALTAIAIAALTIAVPAMLLTRVQPADAARTKPTSQDAAKIKELKSKVDDATKRAQNVNDQIENLDKNLIEADRQLDTTTIDLQRARAQEQHLQDQLDASQEAYEEYRQVVAGRLIAMYKTGRAGYVEAALNSKSFSDFIGRIYYMRTILENDRVMVLDMRKLRDSLKDYHDKIEESNNRIESLAVQINRQKQNIEQEKTERKSTLDKILSEKNSYIESLDRMERESAVISKYIRSMGGAKVDLRSLPASFTGRMGYPARGSIVSGFGMRVHPAYGVVRFHPGIDIACPSGTPVFAAESGTVIISGWKSGYGQTIAIQHSASISTLYGHASRLVATQGEHVKRGDLIMYAGATGNATGPHVHFEVRVNGDPVNPVPYF